MMIKKNEEEKKDKLALVLGKAKDWKDVSIEQQKKKRKDKE